MIRAATLALLLLLGACSSISSIIGVIAGAAAGGGSANPAVGFAVGVGTAAVSDYAIRTVTRHWHQGEQDAIAETAGPLAVGATSPWRVAHSVPIGNEHGQLRVVRSIDTPLTSCREILFSVEESGETPSWYDVDVCRQADHWKWASAEPAVERWGVLQ